MSLIKANQCDLNCPVLAYGAAEFREDLAEANLVRKVGILIVRPVSSLKQMGRAALCPRRHVATESWTPHSDCAAVVLEQQTTRQLDPANFTSHERAALGPVLGLPGSDGPQAID